MFDALVHGRFAPLRAEILFRSEAVSQCMIGVSRAAPGRCTLRSTDDPFRLRASRIMITEPA
jgi:hypothetical protein